MVEFDRINKAVIQYEQKMNQPFFQSKIRFKQKSKYEDLKVRV